VSIGRSPQIRGQIHKGEFRRVGGKLEEDRKSLIATSLAHFINDGLDGILPLLYHAFVSDYQLSYLTISVLTSLQSAFSMVVSPLVGRRSDVIGDFARMITIGLAMFATGVVGYALSVLVSGGTTHSGPAPECAFRTSETSRKQRNDGVAPS
jgi:MFS family permease